MPPSAVRVGAARLSARLRVLPFLPGLTRLAFLARLTCLTRLTLLARLACLTRLALLRLAVLGAGLTLPYALLERLEPAHEIAGLVEGLLEPGRPGGADRLAGLGELLLEIADVVADLGLELLGVGRRPGADEAARVADLLLELALANAVRGLLELGRRAALLAPELGRGRVDVALEVGHPRLHLVLALGEAADALEPLLVVEVAEAGHLPRHVRLFRRQLRRPPLEVLDVARQPLALLPLQLALDLAQAVEGRRRLREALVVGVRGGLAHGVGRLLQPPRRLHHLGRLLLAGEPLEPPRRLLRLVGEHALRRAAAGPRGLAATRPPALPLRLLLLPAGELAQPLHQGVDLVVRGLLLPALHRLVLVLQLVELELEQVGEVLGRGLAAPAPAAASAALLDADLVVGLLGPLQLLQGALLGRQGAVDVLLLERGLGRPHLLRRPRQDRENRAERGVGGHDAAVHPPHQGLDLLAQPPLGQGQEDGVLAELVVGERVPIADHVEGGRDDLSLGLGQGAGVAAPAAAAAPTAAALRLGGAEVAPERPDLDEVEVALDDPAGIALVVAGAAVVRDEVAGLEVELLEEEGVPGRDLAQPALLRVEQLHRLLGPAVDRVGQAERAHPEVVVGAGLEEHLLDGVGGGVAPRPDEHDRRGLVGEHVDGVAWRGLHELAARPLELDLVEAVLLDHEGGGQHPVLPEGQLGIGIFVEHQPAGRGPHGREHRHADLGPLQDRDVPAVLNQPRLESGVGGKVVLELEVVDVRQVDDVDRERLRPHPGRVDVVLGHLADVEQDRLEDPEGRRRVAEDVLGDHRHDVPGRAGRRLHEQVDVVRLEPDELGRHREVRPAGDGDVAGLDEDAVGAGLVEAPGRDHQGRRAVLQLRRRQDEREEGGGRREGEPARRLPHLLPLDRRPQVEVVAPFDGVAHEPLDEGRRVVGALGPGPPLGLLEGAQHARVERGLVLLEVEGHPLVGHPPGQGPDQVPEGQPRDRQPRQEPERDDRPRREPEELEAVRRGEERAEPRRQHDREAAQGNPHAPPVPYAANDADQVFRTA